MSRVETPKIRCYSFLTGSGRSPVGEFVDSLTFKTRRKFYYMTALLEEFGRRLPEPHAKYIGDEIFELRFNGQEGAIRVLYFFVGKDTAVLTNGFIKKSPKTPNQEKKLATQRSAEYLRRQTQ